MSTSTREARVVAGLWRFGSEVTLDQLREVVKGWKSDPEDGPRFPENGLAIRPYNRENHLCIQFIYLEDPQIGRKRSFHYRFKDKLVRQFGAELDSWDMNSGKVEIVA